VIGDKKKEGPTVYIANCESRRVVRRQKSVQRLIHDQLPSVN